jgi:hypothetical protein
MLAEDLDRMSGHTPPVGPTAPVVLVVPEDMSGHMVRVVRMDLGRTPVHMVRVGHIVARPSRKEDLDHMAKQISTTRIDSAGLSVAAC